MDDRQEILAETTCLARDQSVFNWATDHALSCTATEYPARREEFYAQPYEVRRKYYVRPCRASVAVAEEARVAVAAYRKSGDAKHAMRAVGKDLDDGWVEQKRNAAGIVEIPETDLFFDIEGLSPMEAAEVHAREGGLYDDIPFDNQQDIAEEVEALSCADSLLALARTRLPPTQLAIFLAVVVDSQPMRAVAKEFNLSYRQVWQTVDSVRDFLSSIAADEEKSLKST